MEKYTYLYIYTNAINYSTITVELNNDGTLKKEDGNYISIIKRPNNKLGNQEYMHYNILEVLSEGNPIISSSDPDVKKRVLIINKCVNFNPINPDLLSETIIIPIENITFINIKNYNKPIGYKNNHGGKYDK